MREITIDELTRDFDAILEAVEKGARITIRRDDCPVVVMEPVDRMAVERSTEIDER